ncbi:hypothetical protein [Sphingomonas sp. TDK1]|uniref:hypothetical protein n=1 Tax=Sphingomonas sp. TDK1 TaxID=453247 RepID=UPI0007D9F509|nr:hypothetical protein [Sphingomonas sp. TDK1]OAN66702.1 hypothetical protein A7X12_11415 [Sphingomonas sp. TDK1]
MLGRHGAVLLDLPSNGTGGRPEALRSDLRRMLLESQPEEAVQWSKKLDGVIALGGGWHELRVTDGSTTATHLLVGADGAWSKIRPLLSSATAEYIGTTFVETYLHDVDVLHPATAIAAGAGALFALAPGLGIFAHREAGGILHTYAALNCPLGWSAGMDSGDAAAATERLAPEFDGRAPALTALMADSDTAPAASAPRASDWT